MNDKLRFGLNYVPSKNWWYSWLDWDKASISDDLHAISALGFDHVRIHCIWPVFHPNAGCVSSQALDRLAELMDLADGAGLDVCVCVLDGWLSGFAFFPAWRENRNIFTDPAMIDAEERLFRAIAGRVAGHSRFLGFDLGNELGVLIGRGNRITLEEGDAWHRRMFELCEELAPGRMHVSGVDHCQWFMTFGFSRECLATTGAATSVHAWIFFTGATSLYEPLGTGCTHLAEYCVELAKAYSNSKDRLVWVQEFGATPEWMPDEIIPDFAEQTIRNAATCANLWGFTWWCSHDIGPGYLDFAPLEYGLGVLDTHNNVKPVGRRIAGLIDEFRAHPPAPVQRPAALVLPDSALAANPENLPPGWQFAKPYMDLLDDGVRPAVVLESRASDSDYLHTRGITQLIQPA